MIDQVSITVSAGNGGDGCISGRREKYIPHGGPDGGDGGNGGSVYLRCDVELATLSSLGNNRRYTAQGGGNGKGGNKHGAAGSELEIAVPVGTEIWLSGNEKTPVADLNAAGLRVMVAKGGKGGRGNARFSSPTTRFPLLAEEGEAGEERELTLELKLLADVGVVGLPNAGKSSLVVALTAARPRVAEYPFTTIKPALGVVEHGSVTFVMVEVPGLIEGAHRGVGLGHEFLRHVERTRVLVHVLDGTEEDLVPRYLQVRREMELYGHGLAGKPEIVAVNKVDVAGVRARHDDVKERLRDQSEAVHTISAVGRVGLTELVDSMVYVLAKERQTATRHEGSVRVLRPKTVDRRELVRRQGTEYVVLPGAATRLAGMVDQDSSMAIAQLYTQLRRLGVIRALERAGIGPGDVFRVGKLELEWE